MAFCVYEPIEKSDLIEYVIHDNSADGTLIALSDKVQNRINELINENDMIEDQSCLDELLDSLNVECEKYF